MLFPSPLKIPARCLKKMAHPLLQPVAVRSATTPHSNQARERLSAASVYLGIGTETGCQALGLPTFLVVEHALKRQWRMTDSVIRHDWLFVTPWCRLAADQLTRRDIPSPSVPVFGQRIRIRISS